MRALLVVLCACATPPARGASYPSDVTIKTAGQATYLVRGPHVVLLPKHERLDFIADTKLVLIDQALLLHTENGRHVRTGSSGMVIANGELAIVEKSDLVIYDLELAPLRRTWPVLELRRAGDRSVFVDRDGGTAWHGWTGMNPSESMAGIATEPGAWVKPTPMDGAWHAIGHVFVRKTPTHIEIEDRAKTPIVTNQLEAPGPALWTEGSIIIVGETWLFALGHDELISRPAGAIELSVDPTPGYLRDDRGIPYQLGWELSRIPWSIGKVARADASGIVFVDETYGVTWRYDGAWHLTKR